MGNVPPCPFSQLSRQLCAAFSVSSRVAKSRRFARGLVTFPPGIQQAKPKLLPSLVFSDDRCRCLQPLLIGRRTRRHGAVGLALSLKKLAPRVTQYDNFPQLTVSNLHRNPILCNSVAFFLFLTAWRLNLHSIFLLFLRRHLMKCCFTLSQDCLRLHHFHG